MYYKIENKECEVYKKLHGLRTKELAFEKENEALITEKTGMTFQRYLGHQGQQNFSRVTEYAGFAFIEKDKVDPKIWKKHDEEIFVPNTRTKIGREMDSFILNGLKKSNYTDVFEILNVEKYGKFIFPFVEIANEVLFVFLDDKHEPKDENLIEITKKEFATMLQS